ncbi:MAG: hypothetical protein Kow00108_02860 [Calditrichia bacterium]
MNKLHTFVNPLTAMGSFWLFFGVVLLIAIFFVDEPAGKLTNLITSLVFIALGLFVFLKGIKKKGLS